DVFAVQDEIAGLIAKNISPRLGNAPAPARATIDPGAYQEYLLGRAAVARASLASVKEGVVHFERAVAVEPAYTDAWVQLSRANVQLGRWGGLQPVAAWAAAKRAIEKAVELEPDSPDVLVALGWVRRCGDWDWRGAEQAFRRALELRPNHAETIASAAVLLFNVGKEEEGLRLAQQAVELDPLNAGAQLDLGVLFLFSQRPKESEQAVRRALQLAPDGQRYHGHVAFALVEQGRYDEAEAELRLEPDDVTRISCHAFIAIGRGRPAEAREPLRQLEEYGRSHSAAADIDVMIAGIYARLGDRDKAFAPLEHSVATRDPSCAWMRSDIYVRSLHDDPRWQAMMRQIGLADDQLK
ncbi:MAG TPA: tetratricopeptide repeat protein, partial [Candidatus Didemnitutus sp.]|nr:tetratricopeptide repeat protein [Candidatus Didemnitutus sp.]